MVVGSLLTLARWCRVRNDDVRDQPREAVAARFACSLRCLATNRTDERATKPGDSRPIRQAIRAVRGVTSSGSTAFQSCISM